ncbi:tegument protein UL7 [Beluga whale alphaherpesvirus 1]|uniref:Tegument protein UL7 n=1 Tax=Beluga whale alphaherpesvirus 1 TaxID=1434720 RepID=A0A286MM74_9ALPH|nr:tegument protein UL7 [Beluga whale alphaherpesvirus 1]ASW27100.1 tegument protein UL7 [Beluga whale alphaherpesvirus 1]
MASAAGAGPGPRGEATITGSETIDGLIREIESRGGATGAVSDLVWHVLPRFVCEVREIPPRPPVFTTTSVVHMRVDEATGALLLTLAGHTREITCEEYMDLCLAQPGFKGFALVVITAVEDMTRSLSVPGVALPHRLAVHKPDSLDEFSLCVVQMYLESCAGAQAGPELFAPLARLLDRLRAAANPMRKVANFLYVGTTRVLHTLMYMSGHGAFSVQRVLPHYLIAKELLGGGAPPPVFVALFSGRDHTPPRRPVCPPGACAFRRGVLNAALFTPDLQNALYAWWTSPARQALAQMFALYA